jgi:hypothetical protein
MGTEASKAMEDAAQNVEDAMPTIIPVSHTIFLLACQGNKIERHGRLIKGGLLIEEVDSGQRRSHVIGTEDDVDCAKAQQCMTSFNFIHTIQDKNRFNINTSDDLPILADKVAKCINFTRHRAITETHTGELNLRQQSAPPPQRSLPIPTPTPTPTPTSTSTPTPNPTGGDRDDTTDDSMGVGVSQNVVLLGLGLGGTILAAVALVPYMQTEGPRRQRGKKYGNK